MTFPSIGHVALTVSDLGVSVPWYEALFGSAAVLDEDTGPYHHTVFMVGNTMVGLHQHSGSHDTGEFSEFRPGLDHLAFGCEDRAELERWVDRLDALDVPHGGIVDAHYGSGLSFRDPDGIALEFFAPPAG